MSMPDKDRLRQRVTELEGRLRAAGLPTSGKAIVRDDGTLGVPTGDRETRLRALHDVGEVCGCAHGGGRHPHSCPTWDALRAAAAIGDETGYARGLAEAYEDAARVCEGTVTNALGMVFKRSEMHAVAIRARAAKRTEDKP